MSSFNVFSGDGEFDIIIHFNKCVAHRVREKRWPGQQQLVELPNGDVQLHQKLTSLVEVHPWLMTFEGEAYPVEPPALVERHACTLQKMQGNLKRKGL
ncbi:MAG: WYL domain-containing protein [Verrucomicrobia bacterium]|nr:WYL domain-containing protein [Verrucomicrobiota bacterium]